MRRRALRRREKFDRHAYVVVAFVRRVGPRGGRARSVSLSDNFDRPYLSGDDVRAGSYRPIRSPSL